MKRCLGLILAVLLLAGCGNLYPDDYLSVESNQAPYAYRETTGAPSTDASEAETKTVSVSTLGEIRMGIQNLLLTGGTKGRFLLHGYRGDTPIRERVEHDVWYIENWSIWLDFWILLSTVFKGEFVNDEKLPARRGNKKKDAVTSDRG